jgi:hypothetical protein
MLHRIDELNRHDRCISREGKFPVIDPQLDHSRSPSLVGSQPAKVAKSNAAGAGAGYPEQADPKFVRAISLRREHESKERHALFWLIDRYPTCLVRACASISKQAISSRLR